jgi:hypothetical protein
VSTSCRPIQAVGSRRCVPCGRYRAGPGRRWRATARSSVRSRRRCSRPSRRNHHTSEHDHREQTSRLTPSDCRQADPDHQPRYEAPSCGEPYRHQRELGSPGGVVTELLSAPVASPSYRTIVQRPERHFCPGGSPGTPLAARAWRGAGVFAACQKTSACGTLAQSTARSTLEQIEVTQVCCTYPHTGPGPSNGTPPGTPRPGHQPQTDPIPSPTGPTRTSWNSWADQQIHHVRTHRHHPMINCTSRRSSNQLVHGFRLRAERRPPVASRGPLTSVVRSARPSPRRCGRSWLAGTPS